MEALPAQASLPKPQAQALGLPDFTHSLRAFPATLSLQKKPRALLLLGLLPAFL